MYTVEIKHHRKTYYRGDVDSETVLIESKNFKTRKTAKEYVENRLSGKPQKNIRKHLHKGDTPSYYIYFTGGSWFNECTGDDEDEYYEYIIKKATIH